MKQIWYYILAALFIVTSAIASATAQVRYVEHRLVVDIPFELSGGNESNIRHDIGAKELEQALRELALINADTTAVIKSIEFYGSVSPEGSYLTNLKLGKERIATAERIVRKNLHFADSVAVTYDNRLIPWEEILIPAITADTDIPYRSELLKLLCNTKKVNGKDPRRKLLIEAQGGKLYNVVSERYFKYMRKGGAIIIVDRPVDGDLVSLLDFNCGVAAPLFEDIRITEIKQEKEEVIEEKSPLGVTLKTNLLGWGLAISNVEAEFDLCKHLSLAVPVYYSALNYGKSTIKFRTLAFQPELRCWINKNNTGFFAGAHFGLGYYNIAVDGLLRYQDHNGTSPAIGGGISVGYRLPFSKKHNWNIEFIVGAGAYKLHYDTFYNVDNGRLVDTYKKTYIGIDNAAINISYRFAYQRRKR